MSSIDNADDDNVLSFGTPGPIYSYIVLSIAVFIFCIFMPLMCYCRSSSRRRDHQQHSYSSAGSQSRSTGGADSSRVFKCLSKLGSKFKCYCHGEKVENVRMNRDNEMDGNGRRDIEELESDSPESDHLECGGNGKWPQSRYAKRVIRKRVEDVLAHVLVCEKYNEMIIPDQQQRRLYDIEEGDDESSTITRNTSSSCQDQDVEKVSDQSLNTFIDEIENTIETQSDDQRSFEKELKNQQLNPQINKVEDNVGNSSTFCSICLADYEDGVDICKSRAKGCNHFFHRRCILEWLLFNDECPICRYPLLPPGSGEKIKQLLMENRVVGSS